MREFKQPNDIYQYTLRAKNHGKKVGLVPTMGALHEGHLSLIEACKRRADIAVVSIFVNPTQFAPNEDFRQYPRDLRRDKKLLKELQVDALFVPEAEAMYAPGFRAYVEVEEFSKKMCGRSRPTHFRGVATVVTKLLNIIAPDIAFFGEKDFQQQLIIRRLVSDLNLPVEIVTMPTVRELDGLAKSSRNKYLNHRERQAAVVLYRSLKMAKEEIEGGERDARKITFKIRSLIGSEPSVRIDYVAVADPETLEDVVDIRGRVVIALAVYLGKTRLIDNLIVGK
ncbi:pantoate--beta-alanine ligase [candidate division WOR-1 bacterium RIFOXYB2_FULL_48_7]|uniref:Pantothenate synthetase n=1 Tax=candidate division WOR-1 bacterium RIFOXYB2_FULL_48_7 TaxID=1802583 RepID=A0A1F4TU78_UNCSA|nr:MAG: pantoate--beta-alanine ligase [candidate division WOR-1 bacterium RIFOXYB2_FULL_48_7]